MKLLCSVTSNTPYISTLVHVDCQGVSSSKRQEHYVQVCIFAFYLLREKEILIQPHDNLQRKEWRYHFLACFILKATNQAVPYFKCLPASFNCVENNKKQEPITWSLHTDYAFESTRGRSRQLRKRGLKKFGRECNLAPYPKHVNILGVIAQHHSKDDYLQKISKTFEK